MANKMRPVNCVFDTGAGLNIIREDFLGAEWLEAIQVNNRPSLMNETNRKDSIVRTVALHVRLVDSRVRAVFGIVCNLVVLALLGK